MNNLFLNSFNTPFESIPFQDIKQEEFKPAMIALIEEAKEAIDQITKNPEAPTFQNTLVALEHVGKKLNITSTTFFNLHSAETNDFLEELAQEVSPLLTEYGNDITLNQALFERVKSVFYQTDKTSLSTEEYRLLDKTYKSFTRNGALLSEEEKQALRTIDKELSRLKLSFSQNVLQETNAYSLVITDEKELGGLPASIKTAAKEEAQNRKVEGWVFTLQYPSFVPFLKYADNRNRRQELYLASAQKAFQNNDQNNEKNIHDIVALREERAKLLGFASHADFVLQERMAATPSTVFDFLDDLLVKAKPFAEKEIESLKSLAAQEGLEDMMPFDHAYYAEKLRKQKYDIDEEALKPYFSLDNVLKAAFTAAEKLFALTFQKREDIQVYHPEVDVYEVFENGRHKALLYTDWHPREGKRAGAWMTSYTGQYKEKDQDHRPHISIVCNFARPSNEAPSLLTFSEVTTLFHEFGHALHGILANTTFESLSGTNVYWDFVELPSQFMENYCYQKDFLTSFAQHFQTGQALPEEEIDKIVASSNFMEGYQTLRQISFGILDMAYHTGKLGKEEGIEAFEKKTIADSQLYPTLAGTAQSPSFAHIFAGGYSAGYYSYKWAEVLDADAFAYFKETGIFNVDTANKFKTLLSKGGTEDPMQLYVDFRGRKPQADALLIRAGLKKA